MKTLKFIFCLLFVSILVSSCTNLELDEDLETIAAEDVQATGGDDENVNDGSKD
ncbi:hypothetical protein [Psychroserpens luteus]|uniref:Entericidin EcnA/B family protein n=1 Tax=Psychroserpens luteus TaxID=1434066 RepID=A0ABW5ZQZ6_9FLAO|nr:hypothetical protein [Psychroserpens luteus]|tara:strand:- start:1212 stop:1373 length:162 start_codon:yes stop_codon:yes gene_type:complete